MIYLTISFHLSFFCHFIGIGHNHRICGEHVSYFCPQECGAPDLEITGACPLLESPTEQQDDTYPDSLNHLSFEESGLAASKHSADIITCTSSVTSERNKSVHKTSENCAFPWHSSSSEYFDSINNSGSSVFQNSSILRSLSLYQDQYLKSSVQHEGLAECDSLERQAMGVEVSNIVTATDNVDGNFTVNSSSSRNLWMKFDHPTEW